MNKIKAGDKVLKIEDGEAFEVEVTADNGDGTYDTHMWYKGYQIIGSNIPGDKLRPLPDKNTQQ